MKLRLLALLACAFSLHAQDSSAPFAVPLLQGKIEVEFDGKKETLDLADPATAARLKGKVIVVTEINGQRETRVVDAKDAEKLPAPFLWNERPPVRTGPVTFLGIGAIEVPADVAAQLTLPPDTGLQIALVLPDSPATKAGLQESDVIQKFEDQILVTPRQFAVLIANRKEGDVVKLSIFRKGAPLEIPVTLGKRDVPHTAESADKVAKVTRKMVKVEGDFDKELAQKLSDTLHGEMKMKMRIESSKKAEDLERVQMLLDGFSSKQRTELPASEDTGKAIRKALEKLPPEERDRFEELLIESGALPRNALPEGK
jgi:hypothetical protein